MRKLLYILVATMVASLVATSCKTTTKVVTLHDTLTIERSVMQEVIKRDTLYKHDTTNVEIERVIYDTCERIKEVQRIVYRNGKREERGEQLKESKRDTMYLTRTVTKTVTKETKPKQSPYPAILLALVLGGVVIYIGYNYYKFNYRK